MTHNIVAFEQEILEDGEVAVCSCGWRSKRGTARQILAWHKNHVSEREQHKEAEEDRRSNSIEAYWKEKQGEEYGSY